MAVLTHSQQETIAFGERLGAELREGDVLVLTGDLGAGKTQLTTTSTSIASSARTSSRTRASSTCSAPMASA